MRFGMLGRSLAPLALVALVACAHDSRTSTTGATFPAAAPPAARHGSGPIDAFDAKLLSAFASQAGNFVYSPASIALGLGTLERGARGPTAAEMETVLGPSSTKEIRALLPSLGQSMAIADRLYVDQSAPIDPSFASPLVEPIDFRNHPDASRLRINRWVADRTHDKIRDLLGAGLVRRDTRLVLVDAVWLKAQWLTPFPRSSTKDDVFHLASGSKNVPTMHGRVTASMGEHEGAAVLDLPYLATRGGPSLGMTLLVPTGGRPLREVEARYAREGLAPFADAATESGRIDVALPRFRVTGSADVTEALRSLGIKLAFGDQADFSGISSVPLSLSAFVHRAFADVDESGTEASAATTGGMVEITSARIGKPLVFRVDRPFLFFIRDRSSGTILFSGRVVDPSR